MKEHNWRVMVDRGSGVVDTTITETTDMKHLYERIGQMVLSTGIEKIVVYRDGQVYRQYILWQTAMF